MEGAPREAEQTEQSRQQLDISQLKVCQAFLRKVLCQKTTVPLH